MWKRTKKEPKKEPKKQQANEGGPTFRKNNKWRIILMILGLEVWSLTIRITTCYRVWANWIMKNNYQNGSYKWTALFADLDTKR